MEIRRRTVKTQDSLFWLILVFLLFVVTGCETKKPVTLPEAKTTFTLLDIASGGAGKSGRTTESYWGKLGSNSIMRCFHKRINNLTEDGQDCETFLVPDSLPVNATLLAFNLGSWQKTQSVWDLHDDGRMMICDHHREFWSSVTVPIVENCHLFSRPNAISKQALIAGGFCFSHLVTLPSWQSLLTTSRLIIQSPVSIKGDRSGHTI
jgi:hypothetical protein